VCLSRSKALELLEATTELVLGYGEIDSAVCAILLSGLDDFENCRGQFQLLERSGNAFIVMLETNIERSQTCIGDTPCKNH
jgi:hypothetical protein